MRCENKCSGVRMHIGFPNLEPSRIEQLGMWCPEATRATLHGPTDGGLCAPLCPVTAARAEVPLCHIRCLLSGDLYTTAERAGPSFTTALCRTPPPPPGWRQVFLDMGLNRSKYKRASYTLPARKWLILSLTYTAEVNQWNVLHRLRKICFICSPANNNQILWGDKMSPL